MTFVIAPKTFCQDIIDSIARFGSRNNAIETLNVLNSQDPQLLYTIEYENDNKELNFLDVPLRNNLNHSYDFAIYIAIRVFKIFLSRALHITKEIESSIRKSHQRIYEQYFFCKRKRKYRHN